MHTDTGASQDRAFTRRTREATEGLSTSSSARTRRMVGAVNREKDGNETVGSEADVDALDYVFDLSDHTSDYDNDYSEWSP